MIDLFGNETKEKDRCKEIARIIEKIVRNVIKLPDFDRGKYITEDDLGALKWFDNRHGTSVNGKIIRIYWEDRP